MSCKEDNTKVKAFISKLKNLSKEFKAARSIVEDNGGDLDVYIDNVEKYESSMSSALGFASLMNQDYAAINPQKMDTSINKGEQVLTGGNEAAVQTKGQLEDALSAMNQVLRLLQG